MTFNIQDEFKNLEIFLSNITNNSELYYKRREYHNNLLNVFSEIDSIFSKNCAKNFYNNKKVRKKVYNKIGELYDVLDLIQEDNEFKGLREDILIFKYLLVDFEKNIKSL